MPWPAGIVGKGRGIGRQKGPLGARGTAILVLTNQGRDARATAGKTPALRPRIVFHSGVAHSTNGRKSPREWQGWITHPPHDTPPPRLSAAAGEKMSQFADLEDRKFKGEERKLAIRNLKIEDRESTITTRQSPADNLQSKITNRKFPMARSPDGPISRSPDGLIFIVPGSRVAYNP